MDPRPRHEHRFSRKGFSVPGKIFLSFGSLCAILFAIGGLFYFSLRAIERLNEAERKSTHQAIEVPYRLIRNAGLLQTEIFRCVAAMNPVERETHERVVARLNKSAAEALGTYAGIADTKAESELFAEVVRANHAYTEKSEELLVLNRTPRKAEAAIFALTTQIATYDRYQQVLDAVLRGEVSEGYEVARLTTERIARSRIIGNILIALAVVVVLGTAVAVLRMVRRLREDKLGLETEVDEHEKAQQALREGEARYRLLVDHSPDGILVICENKIVFANPAIVRLLGANQRSQLIGRAPSDFVHPDEHAQISERAREVAAGEQPPVVERRMIRLDESILEVESSIISFLYEGKRAEQVIVRDNSERRAAQKLAREAEEKYRAIFDNASEGIFQTTPDGTLLEANLALARMMGFETAEQLIEGYREVEHAYADPAKRKELQDLLEEKGVANQFEYEVKRRDGSLILISENARIVRDPAGRAIYYEGSMQDITERKRAEEELFESRQMLRTVLDNIPQRVFWKDRNSVYLGCNRTFAEEAGFDSAETTPGKTDFDFTEPVNAELYRADDRDVMESGLAKLDFEEPLSTSDGRSIWLKTNKLPLRDRNGKVYGVLGTYEDVTTRHQSEETLRLLNSAVLQSGEAILISEAQLDFPGPRVVFVNPAFTEMTGYSAAEALGQTPRMLQGPLTDKAVVADCRRKLAQGEAFKGETVNYRKDGTAFDMEWQVAPIRDEAETITHFVAIQRDITARKQTEQEQARFAAIMNATTDFVSVADGDGRILYINRAGRKMIGYDEHDDLTATRMADHVAASELQRLLRVCIPTAIREGVWSGEMTCVRRDGREIPLSQVIVTRKAPNGKVDFIATTAQDLTQRREADAALEEANRQLRETSRQAGMAEVATSVLHNVGNVLNSVNVSCSLVSDKMRKSHIGGVARTAKLLQENSRDLATFFVSDPVGKQLPDYLDKLAAQLADEQTDVLSELGLLSQNIEHIKGIVAVQQDFASELGGVQETMPVVELVEEALRINRATLDRHHIEIIRAYTEVPPITTEKHKVLQILINLLCNAKDALKHGDSDGKQLTVRVGRQNGDVIVSVHDNGVGISPENKIRIFSHGFTTRKDGHGFGLHSGVLAAHEMGGTLTVQSDGPGLGAEFTLQLPLGIGS